MAATETFSVRIPAELKRELEEYAKSTQRSSAFVVKEAIEVHLADRRAYLAAIEEALKEEAETGAYVSGEKVIEWLDSWGSPNEKPRPEPDIFLKSRPAKRRA